MRTLRATVWTLRETLWTLRATAWTLRKIVWTLRAIVWTLRAIVRAAYVSGSDSTHVKVFDSERPRRMMLKYEPRPCCQVRNQICVKRTFWKPPGKGARSAAVVAEETVWSLSDEVDDEGEDIKVRHRSEGPFGGGTRGYTRGGDQSEEG
eukprot:2698980-Pyramimonas_sp.AAC.1